ncbi:MAG TPA: MBL fold metallo-hydrolase [Spirochaetota bacterium]|nr:MBL fold metallo-hydrolase [Spirochaetota bacterium]HPI89530.1 MBL fold metallo-hydrolase [Spirochaetota bacterium]HPR47118.1 MBL fold metallo-hydrolase [Spirochaetota bacterium]
MIIEQILVTPMAVFCYLVADKKNGEGVLIDPAGDFDRIFSAVEKYSVTIKWVINTHGHFDHTSGNDHVIKRTGAGLLIHEKDVNKLGSITNRLLSRFVGGKKSPDPVSLLSDGDVIPFGSESLTVLHTPGHSEGSISLYTPGHVFTGDTLFTEGMGRTDLGDGSMKKIMESIVTGILALPDDTIIWPGHHYGRKPTSTVREQKYYYL